MKKFIVFGMLVLQASVFHVFADSVLMSDEIRLCNDENMQIKLNKDFTYEISESGSVLFDGQWEWTVENQSIVFIYQSDGNTMYMQAEITDKIITRDESRIIIIELVFQEKTYRDSNCN